jgi:hypothetical protein
MKKKQKVKRTRLFIEPYPTKVLIEITLGQLESLTSRWIIRDDGKRVKLFTEPQFDQGYDRKFMQNVSVGKVIGVGEWVTNICVGDIAIVDYLVTNDTGVLIGYFKNNQVVCVEAASTYHTEDSLPSQTRRMAWVKGDHDIVSPILGVIRENEAIAFDPHVFLENRVAKLVMVMFNGELREAKEAVTSRIVISAPENSNVRQGDEVTIKEEDIFTREIHGKEMSIVFIEDIKAIKRRENL